MANTLAADGRRAKEGGGGVRGARVGREKERG